MRDWQRSIECFLILGSGQASLLIVDTDVCPLYGEVYEKSISIVPFYEGQLQNRFFGEDAIGRDNVYEPYRILKQILEEEYNIATCDIIPIQKADIVLFFARDYKKMWTAVSMQKNVPMFLSILLL